MTETATKTIVVTQPKPYDKIQTFLQVMSETSEKENTAFDRASNQERRRELVNKADRVCTFDGSDVFLLHWAGVAYRLVVIRNNGEILEPPEVIVIKKKPELFRCLTAEIIDFSTGYELENSQYLITRDNWTTFAMVGVQNKPIQACFLYVSTTEPKQSIPSQLFWELFDEPSDTATDMPKLLEALLPYHNKIPECDRAISWLNELISFVVLHDAVCIKDSIAMLKAACDLNLPQFIEGLRSNFYDDIPPLKALQMWKHRSEFPENASKELSRGFRGAIKKLTSPDEFYDLLKEEELTVKDLHELFGEDCERSKLLAE